MAAGMTMSRQAFEMIESEFKLHAATLPTFIRHRGAFFCPLVEHPRTSSPRYVHVVVKAAQKVEVGNYLLSMSFDVSTGWTNALICGYGVVHERTQDKEFGPQMKQLVDAITASSVAWDNPLILPFIILENYNQRVEISADLIDIDMVKLENKLGATFAGEAGLSLEREKWLQTVDPKEMIVELHSVLPQANFMSNCCKWLREYCTFLQKLETQMQGNSAFEGHDRVFADLRESISLLASVLSGSDRHFEIVRERASLQVNLLYSIISQQDSILNRWDSQLNQLIARSSRQDSISMSTFTFITALFLPGTFVATIFSMTMFNWQPENDGGSSSPQSSNVSSEFWLFWATALPLTIVTMCGWYLWFKYANSKWIKQLDEASIDRLNYGKAHDTSLSHSGYQITRAQSFLRRQSISGPGNEQRICPSNLPRRGTAGQLIGRIAECSCSSCFKALEADPGRLYERPGLRHGRPMRHEGHNNTDHINELGAQS